MSDVVIVAVVMGGATVLSAIITRSGVRRTQDKVAVIEEAVNNKGTGMPTIAERVIHRDDIAVDIARELAVFRDWTSEALVRLAADQGVGLKPVPPTVLPALPATPS